MFISIIETMNKNSQILFIFNKLRTFFMGKTDHQVLIIIPIFITFKCSFLNM